MNPSRAGSMPVCPTCGSDDLVDGTVRGLNPTRFQPTGKMWFRRIPAVHATACLGCGGLWLRVERDVLSHALGRT